MKVICVKVQDIEFIGATPHAIEHDQMMDERVVALAVEPQGAAAARFQSSRRLGIAACKQSHIVPEADQLFGEIGHHPLGPAVHPWRAAFIERSDLRNLHTDQPLTSNTGSSTRKADCILDATQRRAGPSVEQEFKDCSSGLSYGRETKQAFFKNCIFE
jgi:hypothetical protein